MSKKLELTDVENLTYEQAYNELISLVEVLESDQQTLDETMVLFERGQALSKHCATLLDNAELKILQLSGEKLVDLDIK